MRSGVLLSLAALLSLSAGLSSELGCRSLRSVRRSFADVGAAKSPDACLESCQERGRAFEMGALGGGRCFCGTKAAAKSLRTRSERGCSRSCGGRPCGGLAGASLYRNLGQPGEAIAFSVRVIKKNGAA